MKGILALRDQWHHWACHQKLQHQHLLRLTPEVGRILITNFMRSSSRELNVVQIIKSVN